MELKIKRASKSGKLIRRYFYPSSVQFCKCSRKDIFWYIEIAIILIVPCSIYGIISRCLCSQSEMQFFKWGRRWRYRSGEWLNNIWKRGRAYSLAFNRIPFDPLLVSYICTDLMAANSVPYLLHSMQSWIRHLSNLKIYTNINVSDSDTLFSAVSQSGWKAALKKRWKCRHICWQLLWAISRNARARRRTERGYVNILVPAGATVVHRTPHQSANVDLLFQFRIWARKEAQHQTEYALTSGITALEYFEQFYGIPFPLEKQGNNCSLYFQFSSWEHN